MWNKTVALLALTLSTVYCHGTYVMVRSGFGELKGDNVDECCKGITREDVQHWNRIKGDILIRVGDLCTPGAFKYKDPYNLSVALGWRLDDVCDSGCLGLELETLGCYANFDEPDRGKSRNIAGVGQIICPEFCAVVYRQFEDEHELLLGKALYLKNQRILGLQANFYWEQYLLDWLSAGIGCGIGGAYVCTKFTTLEVGMWSFGRARFLCMNFFARKYVHTGAVLSNITLFCRAEKYKMLFEIGFRHISLDQAVGAKCYGQEMPKIANLYSNQVYFGLGRTF
ncbi:MAG: hypothetical protein MJ218_01320 [Opitutales bacterium]|nr:hypothetical protein [Opitutales bacterium]